MRNRFAIFSFQGNIIASYYEIRIRARSIVAT